MRKLVLSLAILSMVASSLSAKTVLGTIYGKHKYEAYLKGSGIYIKRGDTSFGNVCDTRLVSKGKYVLTPSGKALYNNNQVLTEIRRRLYRGDISGCK